MAKKTEIGVIYDIMACHRRELENVSRRISALEELTVEIGDQRVVYSLIIAVGLVGLVSIFGTIGAYLYG